MTCHSSFEMAHFYVVGMVSGGSESSLEWILEVGVGIGIGADNYSLPQYS